jgi:hypothetical protein
MLDPWGAVRTYLQWRLVDWRPWYCGDAHPLGAAAHAPTYHANVIGECSYNRCIVYLDGIFLSGDKALNDCKLKSSGNAGCFWMQELQMFLSGFKPGSGFHRLLLYWLSYDVFENGIHIVTCYLVTRQIINGFWILYLDLLDESSGGIYNYLLQSQS